MNEHDIRVVAGIAAGGMAILAFASILRSRIDIEYGMGRISELEKALQNLRRNHEQLTRRLDQVVDRR